MSKLPDQRDDGELRRVRHDIRGKMNAIMLCTSALTTGTTRAQQLEFLGCIVEASEAMLTLLSRFQKLSAKR